MNYFIAALKDIKEVIEQGARSADFLQPAIADAFKEVLAGNYNTTANNVELYIVSGDDMTRVQAGDEYSLVWSGDEIVGLDFSVEDAKNWIRISADQTEAAEGTIVNISIQSMLPDKSGVDTSDNSTIGCYVQGAEGGLVKVNVHLVNGEKSIQWPLVRGTYQLPLAGQRIDGYRVENVLELNGTLEF